MKIHIKFNHKDYIAYFVSYKTKFSKQIELYRNYKFNCITKTTTFFTDNTIKRKNYLL